MPRETGLRRWGRRMLGAAWLAGGAVPAFMAAALLVQWVDGSFEYRVPYACASMECLHGVAVTADGRQHCAKYPPPDLADGPEGAWFRAQRARGLIFAAVALAAAGYALATGWRWLTRARAFEESWPRLSTRIVAPFAAALLAVQACLALVQY